MCEMKNTLMELRPDWTLQKKQIIELEDYK